jgi:ATP-dependent DNA helicase RecG
MTENTEQKTQPDNSLSLQYVRGIGPKRAEALAAEGILTAADVVKYFPRGYIARDAAASLKDLAVRLRAEAQEDFKPNLFKDATFSLQGEATIVGSVSAKHVHRFGGNRKMMVFTIADGSGGRAKAIFWSFVEYYDKQFQQGQLVVISGKPELDKYGFVSFNHPEIEKIEPEDEEDYARGKILPKYRMAQGFKTVGLSARTLRTIIESVIDREIPNMKEALPEYLLKTLELPDIKIATRNLHFPNNFKEIERAQTRMKFEELYFFQMLLALRHRGVKVQEQAPVFNPKSTRARWLVDKLAFELTRAQKRVINEIVADLQSGHPMNRLLQGDVGSGKTIVALLSMLVAVDNGFQAILMAPTEILAEQHFKTISAYLEGSELNVTQLVGGQKTKARREALENIANGQTHIIVGTHALFASEIAYNNVGLIVIDEQHRFGVAQRAELKNLGSRSLKADGDIKTTPHILVMSATPIPRTLSMTVYGDLDVSIINELPKNRKPIKTKVVFESALMESYEFIRTEIRKGRQAYVVFPLVEKSEKLELKSATEHHEYLQQNVFREYSCGLLHGQMFWYEKEDAMRAFLNNEYQILVATTVIEVGIDVPNASVMLIQDAERFGLAQLHQLRGRVGRGAEQSYCLLATKDHFQYHLNKKEDEQAERKAAIIRLKTMEETTDGFKIAEVDMKLRGPGDVLGTRQSGLPDFEFADLVTDAEIVDMARREAFKTVDADPHLRRPEHESTRRKFVQLYGTGQNFFDVA